MSSSAAAIADLARQLVASAPITMRYEPTNKRGCFWAIMLCTVFEAFFILLAIGSPGYERSLVTQIVYGLVLVTLTSVVWAILFRAQLEARRVSLVAIFALVTMLAVLFSASRYFDPMGIYPG